MKKWCKPEIKSIQEKELLEKLAVKAQSEYRDFYLHNP